MGDFKKCHRCGQEKLVSEFYKRTRVSGYTSECRACMIARSKERATLQKAFKESKLTTFVKSEAWVIDRLREYGIPALPGKALHHDWCDVLAFSCVGIEVKYAPLVGRMFTFNFTPSQQDRGIRGDFLVLVCNYGERGITYHVFDATDPVFYKDGRLKSAVAFTPNRTNRGLSPSLTDEIMSKHSDCWWMIESRFEAVRQTLKTGEGKLPSWLLQNG